MVDRMPRVVLEDVEARARRASEIAAEQTDPELRRTLELEAAKIHRQVRVMKQRENRLMLRR